MTAVGVLARSMLRRGIVGFLLLGVAVGLGMGFSATALAGARRADSAYVRLGAATLAPDALLGEDALDANGLARLEGLDGIRAVARFTYTPVAPAVAGKNAGAFVGLDTDFLERVYRPLVVRGRRPRPGRIDEVMVNETMASRARLRLGQRVELRSGFDKRISLGPVTVVGVVRGIFDVGANVGNSSMLLSRVSRRPP